MFFVLKNIVSGNLLEVENKSVRKYISILRRILRDNIFCELIDIKIAIEKNKNKLDCIFMNF